eukprot:gene44824-55777_t
MPSSPRHRLLNAALAAAFGTTFLSWSSLASAQSSAQAAEPTFNISVPAQPLAAALNELSRQTGIQVFAGGDALAGVQAPALSGRFTVLQALDRLLAGEMTAGHLGQTVVYVMLLAGAVAVLGEVYGDLLRAAGATERLMELLASQSPVAEPASPLPLPHTGRGLAVDFASVQFRYPSRPDQPALADFSLTLAPGETVALVGASGAGKTTVFQLLQRFYDADAPRSGAAPSGIFLNGVNIRDLALTTLRSHIATVPQDAVIFGASALENIRYGKPDATPEEVKAAAQAAFADDFIMALPQPLNPQIQLRPVPEHETVA